MLRIKDDVDLKELEKFGFKFEENKRYESNSCYVWKDMISIKGSPDQILIRAFNKREIIIHTCCGISMEKLYDLIQAGLVEKLVW